MSGTMEMGNIRSRASPCESTIEVASDEVEEIMDWRDKLDAQTVDENAKKHLEKIYPLEDLEDEVPLSNDWLFSNGNTKWPEEVKPFMWRYLHDRSLYRVRKDNTAAVEQLFQELKKRLHLPCDPNTDEEIRKKVERQIGYVTGQWREYGLLIQNQGVFQRTPAFDKHWRHARKQWISQVHNGITTGLVELNVRESPTPTSARIVFGDKEYRTKNYPVMEPLDRDPPVKKKRKLTIVSRESSYEDDPVISDWAPRKRKSSSATKHSSSPVKSPVKRPEVTRRKDSGKSTKSGHAASRSLGEPINLQDARSPTQTMFGDDDDDMYSLNSICSPARHRSEGIVSPNRGSRSATRERIPISSPKKQTARPTSSKSSSGNINGSKILLDTSEKAKLQFIFEDSKAAQDNPLSADVFRNANLPGFFELVCSKAYKPPGVVDCLTFRYTWGTLDAFVISRTATEDDWMKIKRKVRNKFLIAREDLRNKDIDFEVWVTCGDTTKEVSSVRKAEDEDDW